MNIQKQKNKDVLFHTIILDHKQAWLPDEAMEISTIRYEIRSIEEGLFAVSDGKKHDKSKFHCDNATVTHINPIKNNAEMMQMTY